MAFDETDAIIARERLSIRRLRLVHIAGLVFIGTLVVASVLALEAMIERSAADAHIMNVAGRMRRLEEGVGRRVLQLGRETDAERRAKLAGELRDTVETLERSLQALVHGDREMGLPVDHGDDVDRDIRAMMPLHDALVDGVGRLLEEVEGSDNPLVAVAGRRLDDLLAVEAELLTATESLVSAYEAEALARLRRTKRIGYLLLGGVLVALLGLGLFVFRPTLRRLKENTEELFVHETRLEDLVADRTTELEEIGRQLVDTVSELESVNEELGSFSYVVSHDLKAPLRAINALATWLSTDYRDQLDEQGQEMLRLMVRRVARLQMLIDGVLEYSRVGRLKEAQGETDLNDLVRGVIEDLDVPLHIAVESSGLLPTVFCEPTRMRQVFLNLIENAVKYMDKPSGLVRISNRREAGFWRIEVSDNGPGIDAKHARKVFQLFQTLHARDEIETSGVGLAIVQKFVESNGGEVWLDSVVGEGSTFGFSWPADPMSAALRKAV